jgi:hypothetical protein
LAPVLLVDFFPFVSYVILACQKHLGYQESGKWLLEYAKEYAGRGTKVTEHGKDSNAVATSVSSYFLYISAYSHVVQEIG